MPNIQKTSPKKQYPNVPVLMCESETEFRALRKKLDDEIKPKGIIEETYVDDLAALIWEIKRLRDCKVSTINKYFREALDRLLRQLRPGSQIGIEPRAPAYSDDEDAMTKVSEILARKSLDESAIMADAIRLAKENLETLDKMLATARARLDRTLRSIQEYRVYFADRVRRSADQMMQSEDVPSIQANQEESA